MAILLNLVKYGIFDTFANGGKLYAASQKCRNFIERKINNNIHRVWRDITTLHRKCRAVMVGSDQLNFVSSYTYTGHNL